MQKKQDTDETQALRMTPDDLRFTILTLHFLSETFTYITIPPYTSEYRTKAKTH